MKDEAQRTMTADEMGEPRRYSGLSERQQRHDKKLD